MKSNNIWYLDRGKNFFTEEGIDLFETMIAVINTIGVKNKISTNEIIEVLPNKYKFVKNPNALLTTVRNIGLIDKNNNLSNNVKYYLDYKLSYRELILENLSKINYDKDGEIKVKPFFIICMFLYQLYNINPEYSFITKVDCRDYLFRLIDYSEDKIFDLAQKVILNERDYSNIYEAVLDIWFNALQEMKLFIKEERNALKINYDEIKFFEYVYNTCKNKNLDLFDEGIYSLVPEIKLNKNLQFEKESIKEIYNYLFGIDNVISKNYFMEECFGIFEPFRSLKNIAIRKIEEVDVNLAELLFEYNYKIEYDTNNNIENIKEEKKYICPQCGGELGFKKGRYGTFIACNNYPECKYTKSFYQKNK